MIQRIQTVYLLIIVGLMLAMLYSPMAVSLRTDGYYIDNFQGIPTTRVVAPDAGKMWVLPLIYGLVCAISAITIFLYKKRRLQVNLCYAGLVLLILSIAIDFLDTWMPYAQYENMIKYWLVTFLPIISIFFEILTIIRIKKDIKLVKSLSRLR